MSVVRTLALRRWTVSIAMSWYNRIAKGKGGKVSCFKKTLYLPSRTGLGRCFIDTISVKTCEYIGTLLFDITWARLSASISKGMYRCGHESQEKTERPREGENQQLQENDHLFQYWREKRKLLSSRILWDVGFGQGGKPSEPRFLMKKRRASLTLSKQYCDLTHLWFSVKILPLER